jgi:hypothetical protein
VQAVLTPSFYISNYISQVAWFKSSIDICGIFMQRYRQEQGIERSNKWEGGIAFRAIACSVRAVVKGRSIHRPQCLIGRRHRPLLALLSSRESI